MENKRYSAVLFDLDGTINDSGPGIINSVQHALTEMGYDKQPVEKLRKFVGPTLMESFQGLYGMTVEEAEKATALYREYYPRGEIFNLTVYPGILQCFQEIRRSGLDIVLVTAKPHDLAERILEKFDLRKYFTYTTGTGFSDVKTDKCRLINNAFTALREMGRDIEKKDLIMIGDTRFDIEGAKAFGCDAIGVTYGYGEREELIRAKADHIIDCALDMLPIVLG